MYGVFFSFCLISGLVGASSADATFIASAPAVPTVTLTPITALFVQAEYATHFNVHATDTKGRALKYNWSLKLQLVDPAKATNPGTPGSGAAVDLNCNNQGKLSASTLEFIWKHGDGSLGNCDHSKMGPSGHQGRITVVVSDGVWACTAIYNGTNSGIGKGGTCAQLVIAPVASSVKCQGSPTKLFDNSNGGGVLGGGKPPSFSTNGVSYCVMQLITYHWNNGQGAKPGTIGLSSLANVKSLQGNLAKWAATGSSGQGAAVNVNWTANVSTATKPVVINGVYSCVDSDPATWSQDAQTHGAGFCQVYVEKAIVTAAASAKPKTSAKPTTKPKPATAAKCKGTKLSLTATPPNGKPPLSVTFAICSPKSVQWRIDYGDGKSKVAIGSPPTSITHIYSGDGDYVARLTTIASQSATTSLSVTASVSVHLAQLISLTANPASGASPLSVTFGLGTTVANITTWTLDFGDGVHTGGSGKPPVSVTHSYAKDGSFKATFSVKPGAYALVYTVAQITVGAGAPPILGVAATPSSGVHPLAVKFTIGTTIPGVIISWVMKFGDGSQQGGQGKPPASVSHTYTKKGVYLAYLVVSQQQQYGGVQYIVPRNGLAIQVQ